MISRAVCAMIVLCIACGAQAQTIIYKGFVSPKSKDEKVLLDLYVAGLRDGLEFFNATLRAKGGSPFFCLPPKLALTSEQAADILTRRAKEASGDVDNTPIAFLLLEGLEETFPCR